MATDIATLGLAIDARPVATARGELNSFTQGAGNAERATTGFTRATDLLRRDVAALQRALSQNNAALAASAQATSASQVNMAGLERTLAALQQAVAANSAAMGQLTAATQSAQAGVANLQGSINVLSNNLANLQRNATGAGQGLSAVGQNAAQGTQGTNGLSSAVSLLSGAVKSMIALYAAWKIADHAKDAALAAARYETMGIVMRVAGNNAGYTNEKMLELEKQLQKTGISMLQSRNALTSLATANIDLSKATDLARVAQNLAVVANVNSSDALQSLIHGIKSGQTDVLRTLGLNVSFEASYKSLAAQLGTTSEKLTEHQKMVARTNVVLKEAATYNGIYEEAMGTAGKQITSLSRYLDDLSVKAGKVFLPVLSRQVEDLTRALKEANKELDRQGGHDGSIERIGQGMLKAYEYLSKYAIIAAQDFATKVTSMYDYAKGFASGIKELFKLNWSGFVEQAGKAAEASSNARREADAFHRGMIDNGKKATLTAEQQAAADKKAAEAAAAAEATRIAAGEARRAQQEKDEKAQAAAEEARKKAAAEAKRMEEAYQSLMKTIGEKTAAELFAMSTEAKLTEGQQYAAKVMDDLRTGVLKLSVAEKQRLTAKLEEYLLAEQAREQAEAQKKADDERLDSGTKAIQNIVDANQKLREQIDNYELSTQAVNTNTIAKLKNQLANPKLDDGEMAVIEAKIIALQQQNDLLDELATKKDTSKTFDETQAVNKKALEDAKKELDTFFDPAKGQSFAEALRTAFGATGDAFAKMASAMEVHAAKQANLEKARGANALLYLNNKKTEEQYVKDLNALNEQSTKNQLAGYGNMAAAAAGFFGEHSRGYQALTTVSQVFHAAELAMTTAELVPKAISAILSQGQGDPYTAFGRMAAMAALVAGLGVAVGGVGGGSTSSSQQRQASQGTGTVLGDTSAKSDSLNRAIELTATNSSTQINYLSGMLTTLRSIQSGISSFASELVRTTNVTNPSAAGINLGGPAALGNTALKAGVGAVGYAAGAGLTAFTSLATLGGPLGMGIALLATKIPILNKALGAISNAIFGGKQSISDSGITLDKASLATILANGVNAQSYADIHTSGGIFKGSSNDTKYTALGADANRQFTTVIESMADAVKQAGGLLGVSGNDFTAKLNSFVVDIGKISLKDLKGDELQKALEAVFSKLGDQMAQYAVSGLEQFQQVGEGYLQTLVRVASDYAKVDASLQSIGKTFGSVGLSSIAAREELITLLGGIDEFQSKTASFASNFLTQAQQLAPVAAYVTKQLADMNLGWVDTRQEFAQVIAGLDLTSESGRSTYASLMSLADAFAATHAALVDTTKSAQEVADERKDLQKQLDDLTLTSIELQKKERDAVDESNRALYDQVHAIQALKDAATFLTGAVDNTFSVLQSVVGRQKDALTKAKASQDKVYDAQIASQKKALDTAKALADAAKSALGSLKLDDARSQEAARRAALATIQAAMNSARSGKGLPAESAVKDALSVVGQGASKSTFASRFDYLQDFYRTRNLLDGLAKASGAQEDAQQQIVDLLTAQKQAYDDGIDQQVSALDDILTNAKEQIDEMKGQSTVLLSIDQALQAVLNALGAAHGNPLIAGNAAINNAYQTALGRAPDAEGLSYWQTQIANGNPVSAVVDAINGSTEAKLVSLYNTYLGRAPDAAGLQFWMKAYGPTMDQSEVADWLGVAHQDPGYRLPSFAVGTNYVPYDMQAQIHEGEAIIPKADNRALRAAVSNGAVNSTELLAEFRALRQELAAFRVENKAGMIASQRDSSALLNKIKRWDGDGMPAVRSITAS